MLRPAILLCSAMLAVAGLFALNVSFRQTVVQNNDDPENVLRTQADPQVPFIRQAASALLQGTGDNAALAVAAHYLDAEVTSPEQRQQLIEKLHSALESHPTNFYLWARLAQHELALRHYAKSGAAYKMALRTGGFMPSATEWLIENGHANWFYLTEQERALVNNAVRSLFAQSPNAVAGLAYTSWRAGMMHEALQDDAAALALFNRRRALMYDPALRRAAALPR